MSTSTAVTPDPDAPSAFEARARRLDAAHARIASLGDDARASGR